MKKINRRQVIQGLSFFSGLALAKGCSNSASTLNGASAQGLPTDTNPVIQADTACVLFPEQTEGPYYLDLNLLRQDITEGKPGIPLRLALKVVDLPGCVPVANAAVDIWHCDASGAYSGYGSTTMNPRRGPFSGDRNSNPVGAGQSNGALQQPADNNTVFLRGTQVTDNKGQVEFLTLYPGWYPGRTPHIHLKVHLNSNRALTSQLYFPDEVTNVVYEQVPYNSRPNRDTTNARDGILSRNGNGSSTQLNLAPAANGYMGSLTIGVQQA